MNAIERQKYWALLREGSWFGGLPLGLQSAILDRSVVRWYTRGSIILLQDSAPEALFAVLEGQVAIEHWATPDQPVLIDLASPGTWFSELALLLHTPATEAKTGLGAVARTDARLLSLRLAAFEDLVRDDPDTYRWFARLALERYDVCLRSEAESRVLTAEELVTAKIADLADSRHHDRSHGPAVVLELTQSDIAALTGLSRQTVNGELHRLEQRGLVELAFRQIRIADVERLRDQLGSPHGARRGDRWPVASRLTASTGRPVA